MSKKSERIPLSDAEGTIDSSSPEGRPVGPLHDRAHPVNVPQDGGGGGDDQGFGPGGELPNTRTEK
jgi:hypothetical protein